MPKPNSTQYEARDMTLEAKHDMLASSNITKFLEKVRGP